MTRAEKRRLYFNRDFPINRGTAPIYGTSGLSKGMVIGHRPIEPAYGRSKYMPHIGAKQRAKGAAA